ncbi:MAG: YlxR family protein [Anaerolineales bacterium]|nr:YlxR family protein [Anaerolineales bacterium]
MVKKNQKRIKHIPQRTCVGCKIVQPKLSLIRIVRTTEGLQIDEKGKTPGRGAYLHNQRSCWEKGMNGSLAHALKTSLTDQDKKMLYEYMAGLPVEKEPAQ